MQIVIIIMTCGMLAGYLFRSHQLLISIFDKLSTWAIYLLLFLLGISIGANSEIFANLHTLGFYALIITFGAVLGSVLLVWPVYHYFFKKNEASDDEKVSSNGSIPVNALKGSLIILLFFGAGVILGLLGVLPKAMTNSKFSQYALYLLMLLVGFGIGADERALKAIKGFSFKIFLVPITTIVGTLVGVLMVSIFINGIALTDLMALGSGFGYYSLSSIIITDMRGSELGVIALLSNVMREIVTLLLAPLFANYFGRLAPIVSGGATSMDTTLPIISATSGKEYAIVSLFHGIILTILVPFIVTFFASFG